MPKESAGLIMYRLRDGRLEFLLAHPGGPFWQHKDTGAWTVPKGELEPGEDPLAAAQREFEEELGIKPHGNFLPLTPIKQKSGKVVRAWAFEGDSDPSQIKSNTCVIQWPPRSGRTLEVPEVDRAAWFDLAEAEKRLNPAQVPLVKELVRRLSPQTARH